MTDLARLSGFDLLQNAAARGMGLWSNYKKGGTLRWPSHRSIRRRSIITQQPLIITPPLIITIRLSIITRWVSTTTQSIMQLRRRSIVNLLTNIRRLHTHTRTNNDPTYTVFAAPTQGGACTNGRCGVGSPSGPSPIFSVRPPAFRHREAKVLSGKTGRAPERVCPGCVYRNLSSGDGRDEP
jgi:hypothetical protein